MQPSLSRREREIMNIVYRRGSATAKDVLDDLPNPPGYSAVRALLRILVDKQHLQYRQDGPRYIYSPNVSRQKAARSALNQMVDTFFEGSAGRAAQALLGKSAGKLSREDLDELSALINAAREKER